MQQPKEQHFTAYTCLTYTGIFFVEAYSKSLKFSLSLLLFPCGIPSLLGGKPDFQRIWDLETLAVINAIKHRWQTPQHVPPGDPSLRAEITTLGLALRIPLG